MRSDLERHLCDTENRESVCTFVYSVAVVGGEGEETRGGGAVSHAWEEPLTFAAPDSSRQELVWIQEGPAFKAPGKSWGLC